jgi:hypothetical protein
MHAEIEGVKFMVAEFADLLASSTDEVPLSLALVTFTENSQACYISLKEFQGTRQGLAEARDYVRALKVSALPTMRALTGTEIALQHGTSHRPL